MVSGGQISMSKYFADITPKEQIIVTALSEFEIIFVDLILVSRFVLNRFIARLLTQGTGISLVSCVGASLVALHYSHTGVARCLQ